MTLRDPVIICPNLEPGVQIGTDSFVTIRYAKRAGDDGRTRYRYTIIRTGKPDETDDDIQSGCDGGDLRGGLTSLLSFLGAFAESLAYRPNHGTGNTDLFPSTLAEWAVAHSDEITMAECEVEEMENCIEE